MELKALAEANSRTTYHQAPTAGGAGNGLESKECWVTLERAWKAKGLEQSYYKTL